MVIEKFKNKTIFLDTAPLIYFIGEDTNHGYPPWPVSSPATFCPIKIL